MKSLAIISSPLQLLSLGEFIFQGNIKNYFLIILYKNKQELDQIKSMCNFYNVKISSIIKGRKLFQYLSLRLIINKLKNVNQIILGNFFSDPHIFILNNFKTDDIVVLDDGMVVHRIPNYINSKKKILTQSRLRNLIFSFFNIKVQPPSKIRLFTIFSIKSNRYIKVKRNELSYLYSKLGNIQSSQKIILIGQPFVELNTLSRDNYFLNIKKIVQLNNLNVIYYPSRKEDRKNLELINQIDGIEVINPTLSIELYLIKNSFLPKKIIGFTSSALVTLKIMFYKKINIESYKINFNQTRYDGNFYESIYENFKKYGIKYKSLNI